MSEEASSPPVPEAPGPGGIVAGAGLLDSCLDEFAARISQSTWTNFEERAGNLPETIEIGSACSGTDVWAVICEKVIARLSSRTCSSMRMQVAFACEKDGTKQRWLSKMDTVQSNPGCCILADVHEMVGEEATCVRHGGVNCRVKSAASSDVAFHAPQFPP